MKKFNLTFSEYKLKFKQPFKTAKKEFTHRKGVIIKINCDSTFGLGDCAPFPEFSSEKYEQAIEKLNDFNLKLKLEKDNLIESIAKSLSELDEYHALKHGIEQAILNFICNKTNLSLNELLNVESSKTIKCNAVIGFLSIDKSIKVCGDYLNSGFDTIKLKIGRDNFEDDFKIVSSLRDNLGFQFNLRMDVNGKWNLSEAIKYIKLLEKFNIEYIEQPVNSIDDFIKLKQEVNVPIAADESIRNLRDAENFITKNAADVLIIKPMMIGGLISTLNIIELCEKNKKGVVITSSFESALGISFAIFAASTIKNVIAHGLGTAKYFKSDIYSNPYPIKNGLINLR